MELNIYQIFVYFYHTHTHRQLYRGASRAVAYPGDGLKDGQGAQWAGPPTEQRGLEAGAGLVGECLALLQRNLGADSGAGLYDLYLLYRKDVCLDMYTSYSL